MTSTNQKPIASQSVTSEDMDERSRSLVARKRQRPHTPLMWARVKPRLEYYYIEMDMTLRDAMQRINEEYNFDATEQMYKKRLKAWGLSKHVKADSKEKALAMILHNDPVPRDYEPIPHDRLLRYAKSRTKSGEMDTAQLAKIKSFTKLSPTSSRAAASRAPAVLARSPELPGQFADFDLFLRAMQGLIERERKEWLTGEQKGAPDAIFSSLATGLSLWRNQAFAAARRSFGQAACETVEDLRGPSASVSRITYCISSILWGSVREPVFVKFVEFMVKAALENLGPTCPMTIVLQYLQREQSVEAQVRIWACALDGYHISEQNWQHWWNMAQRRWLWCCRSGKFELAAQYCSQALIEARSIDRLSLEMEEGAQNDLKSFGLEVNT